MHDELPEALVLMKFLGDHWRDETYRVISEVLAEAGYAPVRADQIRTSGPVVDEVCRLIESSSLVVADTTGDSHNVSYEIGYAHGIKRGFDSTILLGSTTGGSTPFNYGHFRVLNYRDRRHLRRLLREWLSLSVPLSGGQIGLALNFTVQKRGGAYGQVAANLVLEALRSLNFTGRCEYYAGDAWMNNGYLVGLACRIPAKEQTPDNEWWGKFLDAIPESSVLTLDRDLSELGEISGLRSHLLSRGAVEFRSGKPLTILNPGGSENESWFIIAVRKRMGAEGVGEKEPPNLSPAADR